MLQDSGKRKGARPRIERLIYYYAYTADIHRLEIDEWLVIFKYLPMKRTRRSGLRIQEANNNDEHAGITFGVDERHSSCKDRFRLLK